MTESTKIEFRHRRINEIADVTDLVAVLFPDNRNQQHAAARILIALKEAGGVVPSLNHLEQRYNLSRRTIERTRAKLARLGLIERVTWMNRRHNGRQGWILSVRMSSALRQLANKIDAWRMEDGLWRREKDEQLADLLR